MDYSYFIRKNIDYIKGNDYIIYPNGKQISKKTKNCEVLITDYTVKRQIFEFPRIVVINIWIKDSFSDVKFFDKFYKGEFFHPKMEKLDKKINKIIDDYERNREIKK